MPPILPKRCPVCTTKCTKTPDGYWLCPNPTCGWTDDPAVLQPALAATPPTAES